MTSQCPVKIHVVASCSILHNKITVPASIGKLSCLLLKLKQTHSILLQVRDKTRTNRRWNNFNQLFSFSTKTPSVVRKISLQYPKPPTESTRAQQDTSQCPNNQWSSNHHLQFLEGPTLPRSQNTIKSYTNPTVNHNIYIKPQLIFQLEKTPNEQTVERTSIHWSKQKDDNFPSTCIYYLLSNLVFFQKFYFVVEPERPIATVPLVRPGWTICWKFFQLINSIDIPLGTNREATPPILMPNQCCISSRLFFTVTTTRSVLQYRIPRSEYKW